MTETYERPRLVLPVDAVEVVDNAWGAVAAIVAALLGLSAAWVYAVCTGCNTIGSVQDCYNTVVTILNGGYC